jgi:lipopolysaccharide/colanic/teichoic acid biosynthesis glycosyltransferase
MSVLRHEEAVMPLHSRRRTGHGPVLRGGSASRRTRALKRAEDMLIGTVLAVLSLPALLLLTVVSAVVLRSWPLFVQRRPGARGREFTIVKIRTMPPSAPKYALKFDIADQLDNLPAFCKMLRRTHLDELPQLLLVPFGSMSLVGPRPRQPDCVEPMADDTDALRTSVRPGCTGVWQISEARSGLIAGAPEYDEFYLRHMSVRFDLWIMARTFWYMAGFVRPILLADIPQRVLGARRDRDVVQPVAVPSPGVAAD